jgi:hypothetical protein
MRALRGLVLAGAAAWLGCGESATETASDGRIQITVTTTGADPQAEEYLLTLDGARPLAVTPDGSIIYDAVPEGTHVIHLFALADNCAVSGGSSPRAVNVRGGDFAEITFSVVCSPPVTGGFRIVVSTTGTATDDDGYQLTVEGAPRRTIAINAEETFQGLEPGAHLVTLKDVADFCEVQGGNPQLYTVIAGKTVRIAVNVRCGGAPGPLD